MQDHHTHAELWRNAPAHHSEEGLYINGHLAVASCEALIQTKLVQHARTVPHPSVLEIGFGLGFACAAIRRLWPARHIIVEANTAVAEHAVRQHSSAHVVNRFWEEYVPTIRDSFDLIVFDPCPIHAQYCGTSSETLALIDPFLQEAPRLLSNGGALVLLDFSTDSEVPREVESLITKTCISTSEVRFPCTAGEAPWMGSHYSIITLRKQ